MTSKHLQISDIKLPSHHVNNNPTSNGKQNAIFVKYFDTICLEVAPQKRKKKLQ